MLSCPQKLEIGFGAQKKQIDCSCIEIDPQFKGQQTVTSRHVTQQESRIAHMFASNILVFCVTELSFALIQE